MHRDGGGLKVWAQALRNDLVYAEYSLRKALRGYYHTLPLHWVFVLGFLPFIHDRLMIFSLLAVLEIFLFFAEIYTRRCYAKYRLHALYVFALVVIEDRMRGVGFLDGVRDVAPATLVNILDGWSA